MARRKKRPNGGSARSRGRATRTNRDWRTNLERADRRTRLLVREQPILSAIAAMAAGYVFARMARA